MSAQRSFLALLAACLGLAACQPDPGVAVFTNTPRSPGISISTSTLAPTDPPSTTPTASATIGPTLTPSLTSTASATYTLTPTNTFTATLTPSATFTWTPYPTKAFGATSTPRPTYAPFSILPPSHLWFARPIGDDGENFITRTYTYGNTMNGTLRPHHGVEFYNPVGTPILAAGDGIVVFAGPDVGGASISPQPNFYGNAVVIQHSQSLNGQPVFTLYGHMSFVAAVIGQVVHAGDVIGKVGGTGVALGGPHLHFEVRVGYNDYDSTRNPELWLIPFPKWGTLVGRVVDSNGNLIPLASVTVRSQTIDSDSPVSRFITTYADETVNSDENYGENFAVMDLPAGTYAVQIGTTKTYTQTITIKPDQVSFVEFRDVNPPPTWTATPTDTATPRP
jgi:murein DD-endopeptidase MepM/ murein hydrolase activator NlpD